MSDAAMSPFDPEENLGLPASFSLTDGGWEEVDLVEPGPDWQVMEDGTYQSPDGLVRTRMASDPVEWSDAEGRG